MDFIDIYNQLNDEQKEATSQIQGSCMIIAGPGSGKTKTLVVRTARMLREGVNSKNIILFTFTNKAAKEIKKRIIDIIGEDAKNITVGTYHSVCGKFLRQYAEHVGLNRNFSIYDSSDSQKIIKNIIKKIGCSFDEKKISKAISIFKRDMKSPDDALKSAEEEYERKIAEIYKIYEESLVKNNAVDFDNLILKTISLLENNLDVKKEINNKYKYITADECHDSSLMDLKLIRLLAGEAENVCMIIDENQSIYGFRGAKIDAVMSSRKIYNNMRTYVLNTNYRSTQAIVNACTSMIDNNTKMIEKNLKSANEKGNPIIFFREEDINKEALKVIELIKLCANKYKISYKDIAVLYRNNKDVATVEKAMVKFQIPYTLVNGVNFASREEIKDILAYLKMIFNPNDVVSFERIINTPKRGLGNTFVGGITSYAIDNRCSFVKALCEYEISDSVKPNIRNKISDLLNILEDIEEDIENESAATVIRNLLVYTNYKQYILDKYSKDSDAIETKMNNIEKLIEISESFENIEDLITSTSLDANAQEEDSVSLMTMHSSKGLEWKVVIIISAIDGNNPSFRATTTSMIEEERRLFYVACSRAEKLLFITSPKVVKNNSTGKYVRTIQSRFIEEIDSNYIKDYYAQ